jgi:hypothetical protein
MDSGADDDTHSAIYRVLEAERTARGEIQGARGQALTILREARARARVSGRRADRHICHAHALCDAALARTLAALAADAATLATPPSLTGELERRLETALDQLLDELTGGPP